MVVFYMSLMIRSGMFHCRKWRQPVDVQFISIEKSTNRCTSCFQGNLQETDETGMFSPDYNVGPVISWFITPSNYGYNML